RRKGAGSVHDPRHCALPLALRFSDKTAMTRVLHLAIICRAVLGCRAVPRGVARRPGVILLVVLGVLVIFSLVVLLFVLSARQHHLASRAHSRVGRYDDNFEERLDGALMTVLRGAANPACSIRHHSLLEDMYGDDSLPAGVADPR